MSNRCIPSLKHLFAIQEDLPDAELWPEDYYRTTIRIAGKDSDVKFRRVKLKKTEGKAYQWIYEGKVLVR